MPQAKTFGQTDLGGSFISSSSECSWWIWLLMPSTCPAPTTATTVLPGAVRIFSARKVSRSSISRLLISGYRPANSAMTASS